MGHLHADSGNNHINNIRGVNRGKYRYDYLHPSQPGEWYPRSGVNSSGARAPDGRVRMKRGATTIRPLWVSVVRRAPPLTAARTQSGGPAIRAKPKSCI